MTALHISPTLDLPDDFATESIGIVGIRGSGKSNTGVVLAEEMWDADIPWVAIDPKGDWHGIRSSADGTAPGLPIIVFGGLHGDLPLEHTAGQLVADLLVDQNLTAVLDVSRFSGAQLGRFLVDFCHRLFWRHQEEPHVRHVFFEEAHRYIPQQVSSATAAMKEACAKIPLEGRSFGLGSSTMTQRPARLHKDVTTQFGTFIAMRVMAKQDRDAVAGWLDEQEFGKEALATLSGLQPGEAWILSPLVPLFERVAFRQRRTFDSGATPKVGQARRKPATVADVDLAAITTLMAETIEKAKADDPKELRKQLRERDVLVADLCRQLEKAEQANEVIIPEEVEVPVVDGEALSLFAQLLEVTRAVRPTMEQIWLHLQAIADGPPTASSAAAPSPGGDLHAHAPNPRAVVPVAAPRPREPRAGQAPPTGDLTDAMRDILAALAQAHSGWNGQDLAVLLGKSYSGGFRNYLSSLRTSGYIVGANKEPITITAAGIEALGSFDLLPVGRALLDHWLNGDRLTTATKDVLRVLADEPGLSGPGLAERLGKEYSGGFRNYLSTLRTLRLIVGTNQAGMRLSDLLEDQ